MSDHLRSDDDVKKVLLVCNSDLADERAALADRAVAYQAAVEAQFDQQQVTVLAMREGLSYLAVHPGVGLAVEAWSEPELFAAVDREACSILGATESPLPITVTWAQSEAQEQAIASYFYSYEVQSR